MSIFKGVPVYIELTSDQKIFEIVTIDQNQRYTAYDVDWCDGHGHYHAHESGGATFPMTITHRGDGHGGKTFTYYWIAPHLEIQYQDEADPAYCVRFTASQLVPLFISEDDDLLKEFLDLHEIPTCDEMNDMFVFNLVLYWEEAHLVEEGQVIYCSICDKHYDYEEYIPCEHIKWCDECGCFSQPPGSGDEDCPHRSPDGDIYYVEPIK